MKIINCTFNSNHAKDGGAIYTLGNITIEDSTFKSNDAYNETKGSNHHAGAIYIKGKQSSIKNSIFDSNYANVHGAIYFEGINLTLNNCSFKLNRAGGSGALGTKGKYLQVNNCTFESNNGTNGFGGAINSEGTKLNISNSTFRENCVVSESGGALSLDKSDVVIFNSTFELNDGGHGGGAIFAQNFKVNKILPTLNIDSKDIAVGKDGKIVITLPTDATGTVTIEVDGKTYTAQVENGKAIFIIPGLSEVFITLKFHTLVTTSIYL